MGIAFAQDAAPKGPPGGGFGMIAPLAIVFVIFYFMLIRPQARQQKKHKSLLGTLKRGDEVILAAGIHGRVQNITDQTVSLEIAENVRIRIEKTAIATVKGTPAAK